ncbi:MAG: hypothetical protein LLG37_00600 [Spirochaetia bacterium]|nr:hypothetical protein [Spirochaetia bacterium]
MSNDKNKEQKKQGPRAQDDGAYTLRDYLIINAIFWAFLLVLSMAVFFTTGAKWDPIMQNVFAFIFLVFGLGFTGVSIFDMLYEKISKRGQDAK